MDVRDAADEDFVELGDVALVSNLDLLALVVDYVLEHGSWVDVAGVADSYKCEHLLQLIH